jgi:hypothetical protein
LCADFELRDSESRAWLVAVVKSTVEERHQSGGRRIVDIPKAGDAARRSGGERRCPQSDQPSKWLTAPIPVSHAESTTSSVPERSSSENSPADTAPVPMSGGVGRPASHRLNPVRRIADLDSRAVGPIVRNHSRRFR